MIDVVDMLSSSAFNDFLSTLEEPRSHAIFNLATTEKHKILPTILSRCQVFDFKRMPTTETVKHLQEISEKENVRAESDALHLIAQKSEGCMRDALSILVKIISFTGGELTYKNTLQHLNILDHEFFFRINDAILAEDTGEALLIYDEILQKGCEGDDFIDGYAGYLRDLLVCKDERAIHLMEVAYNLKAHYKEQAEKLDAGFLVTALNILNETGIQYKQARNKRLQIEMCLIRLSYLRQAVSLVSNEQSGAVAKKKVTDRKAQTISISEGYAEKRVGDEISGELPQAESHQEAVSQKSEESVSEKKPKNSVTTVLKGQAQTSPKENAKPSQNNSEPKKKQGEVPNTNQ